MADLPGAIWRPSPSACRRRLKKTTCAIASPRRLIWAITLRAGRADCAAAGRARHLSRRARVSAAHSAGAVSRRGAGGGALSGRRHPLGRDRHADVWRGAKMDLVRLAIPRRVYTQSHMDYVIEVILEVWQRREEIRGMRLTYQAPFLRHFTAHLEPIEAEVAQPVGSV